MYSCRPFGNLGALTPEQQEQYNKTGMLPEVVVTPDNAGQNAVTTQWNTRNPWTLPRVAAVGLGAAGLYMTIAGIVNLFRKRYAGKRLRYSGGYLLAGMVVSGLGLVIYNPKKNTVA